MAADDGCGGRSGGTAAVLAGRDGETIYLVPRTARKSHPRHCGRTRYTLRMTTPEIFSRPAGGLPRGCAGWESRPQQIEMANLVAEAIAEPAACDRRGRHRRGQEPRLPRARGARRDGRPGGAGGRRVEPAEPDWDDGDDADDAPRAPRRRGRPRRVVISTHTIALQEQLVTKDIPLVAAVMPREFSAVLVKGRGNYVSLRRLELAVERSGSLFPDDGRARRTARARHLGQAARPTARSPTCRACPATRVWDEVAERLRQLHGPRLPDATSSATTTPPGGGWPMPRCSSSTTRSSSPISPSAAAGRASCPDHDIVIFDEAHTRRGRGERAPRHRRVERRRRAGALQALQRARRTAACSSHYRMHDLEPDVLPLPAGRGGFLRGGAAAVADARRRRRGGCARAAARARLARRRRSRASRGSSGPPPTGSPTRPSGTTSTRSPTGSTRVAGAVATWLEQRRAGQRVVGRGRSARGAAASGSALERAGRRGGDARARALRPRRHRRARERHARGRRRPATTTACG